METKAWNRSEEKKKLKQLTDVIKEVITQPLPSPNRSLLPSLHRPKMRHVKTFFVPLCQPLLVWFITKKEGRNVLCGANSIAKYFNRRSVGLSFYYRIFHFFK